MTGESLADFLLARIAEDEADARAAIAWSGAEPSRWHRAHEGVADRYTNSVAGYVGDGAAQHIARWDPARVLAECEAKRRIIEFQRDWPILVETPPKLEQGNDPAALIMRVTQQIAWTTEREYVKRFGTQPPTTPMMRAMAAVYADHPDYRQEWAP